MNDVRPTCPQCGSATMVAGDLCAGCLFDLAMSDEFSSPPNEVAYERGIPATGQNFGAYELQALIGRSMALVYRAAHTQSGRIVALKMVPPQQLHDDSVRERFKTEVRATAALDHPNILPIYEVGERDGLPYFSMKLAEGGALSERSTGYRGKFREIAALVAKVARALNHAHQRGILHRDVKPGNILLDRADEPFLVDFGIAKSLAADVDLTRTLSVLGTPAYLSPEQAAGKTKELTTATDIYGLGAVLYELLTGHPPFEGASAVEILHEIERKSPERPTVRDASIPRDLEIICWKCLAKEPRDRYSTADALAEDLERWKDGRTIIARPATRPERVWRWARRNPALASLSAALLVLLIAAAVVSSLAALRFNKQRKRAESAEHGATEQLRAALVAQATAAQLTGQAGQRFESLAALQRAAAIHPSADVRDLYANAFTLADLRIIQSFAGRRSQSDPLAFDADLAYFATEAESGVVVIRSVADQRERQRLVPPEPEGTSIAPAICITPFSEDGRWLAIRHADETVRVWNVAENRLSFKVSGRPTAGLRPYLAHDCAFSPQGSTVAIGLPGGGCTIHETSTGREVARIASSVVPACLVFDPSGTRLALLGKAEDTIHVFDVATGHETLVIRAPRWLAHLAWSPDGESIAAGCADASIHAWDAHSGALLRSLKGHSSTPSLVAFSHSGRLIASTARDNTIRLWDARSGNALVCLASHCSEPGLRFSRDDRRLSLSAYGSTVGVLEIAFDEIFQAIPPHLGSGTCADFGRMTSLLNGRVLAAASSTGLRLSDLDRKTDLAFIPIAGHELTVAATARGDGFFLCGGEDGFRRWTLEPQSDGSLTLKPGTMRSARQGDAVTGASTEDRLLAFASQSRGALTLVREENSQPLEVLGHDGIWQAVPSPDGRLVASGYFSNHHPERENVRVEDAATGTQLAELPTGTSSSAAFSPDGRWLAAGGITRSGLWRTSDWELAVEFKQEALNPEFAARSDFLAAVSDPDVSILRVPDGMNLGHLKCPENPTLRLCAGDGRLIMMAADSTTFVWDLRALRRELRAAGLDWDLPALPDAEDAARGELRVVSGISNPP